MMTASPDTAATSGGRAAQICLVVVGSDGQILRTAPGNRIYSSRAAAAQHQRYLLAVPPDMRYAMARVVLIEDDPHNVPDEDLEGGAPDA
jgi:hypothetical protein